MQEHPPNPPLPPPTRHRTRRCPLQPAHRAWRCPLQSAAPTTLWAAPGTSLHPPPRSQTHVPSSLSRALALLLLTLLLSACAVQAEQTRFEVAITPGDAAQFAPGRLKIPRGATVVWQNKDTDSPHRHLRSTVGGPAARRLRRTAQRRAGLGSGGPGDRRHLVLHLHHPRPIHLLLPPRLPQPYDGHHHRLAVAPGCHPAI